MKNYTFVDYATQAYMALVGLLILLFHNNTVPDWPELLGAHGVGLVLVHYLIQTHARRKPAPLLDFLRHFYPVLLYTAFFIETGSLNRMFFKGYLDPMVAQWEQGLFGCQPSVLFMQKLPWLAVSELFYAAYFSYYIMIAGVGIALFLRDRQQFFHYVSVVSFLFYVCYLIYIFLPVIGSRAFFHQVEGYSLPQATQQLAVTDTFPDAVQAGVFFRLMRWLYRVFEAPGAALPSSHVAVASCTVFFSFRYLRRIRYVHLAVAILLCLSTVYCRYHYVVDALAGLVAAAVLIPTGNWLYFKSSRHNQERKAERQKPLENGRYRDVKLHSKLFGWSDPDQALRVAAGILGKRASDGLRLGGRYCQRCEAFPTMHRTWKPQSGVELELGDMVKTK